MNTPDQEAEALLAMHRGALAECLKMLSMQLTVIQTRSQLLLTLATLSLTITGFSGPRIAHSGWPARVLLAIGLSMILIGIAMIMGSLRITWLTQFAGADARDQLRQIIVYRNKKTVWFTVERFFVGIGIGTFVAALLWYLAFGDVQAMA